MELQGIKQRFDIIGDDPVLNRALDIAIQVAATDLSVLVTGESGVGKEALPQIIHQNSARKHNVYVAINCGAIPEGTIDSELFGHEKGSFTGATETRKGYFEVADGGTIFLDEVAELPLATQVRLLRILQSGEFYKVGSSRVQKTDVRVVAATNVNVMDAVRRGKFREDLYYRLNTVPIHIPALRERKGDINLLFRKFALDFADKYHMPVIRLTRDAQIMIQDYRWPGNIRQLKSVAEQVSILEQNREISGDIIKKYLPADNPEHLPVLNSGAAAANSNLLNDRDVIYKLISQLKNEIDDLKKRFEKRSSSDSSAEGKSLLPSPALGKESMPDEFDESDEDIIEESSCNLLRGSRRSGKDVKKDYADDVRQGGMPVTRPVVFDASEERKAAAEDTDYIPVENLSIESAAEELIRKSLEKHNGNRDEAARELGISARTLYRKIKKYNIK
ncbi:MAG: sigma-54 dependent transcriptional regulator [Bacteroidales bacterium]|jgi:transcriptional regulator with PAS, ATPase and Fis domain|nr:sigma-54 dependent transcriptional regulator [Bacteroidales bacterium]